MSDQLGQPTDTQPPVTEATSFYVVGGSMRPETPSYIERAADDELYRRILAGEFCYVLTPRQMGKSSLMARTAKRLREQCRDYRTAILDLSRMGGDKDNADSWYYGLAHRLLTEFRITANLKAWWQERSNLPALQRLSEVFDLLLSKRSDRMVVFMDEIDWTIRLPYSDDLFAAIRACYNARATNPEYQRLTFVLLGVASPSDLIKDPTRTPFNIGHRINLTDFAPEEAKPLARGLHEEPSKSELLLNRILYWTSGHPYLTQKLCDLMAKESNGESSEQMVDRLVNQQFLTPDASRTEHNLTFVRDRILRDNRKGALIRLYLRIVHTKIVADDPRSPLHTALKLSGLVVVRENSVLTIRNRIYELVFTESWGKEAMPTNWPQRMVAGSLLLLLISLGIWYEIFLPRPYIEALQTASEDYPIQPYNELRKIPGYAGKADELLAEYWDRRALKFAAMGNRDQALLSRLQGLTAQDSDLRRREARLLMGPDYENLISTYRHGDVVDAIAFSPDGTLALTGSRDRTARLWRTDTGAPVGEPLRHKDGVDAIAFSPDGTLALTGSRDRTARLWRTDTGAPVGEPLRHKDIVEAVAFSPDGTLALTGSWDRTARLWRTDTGAPVGEPLRHKGVVNAVAFSPDGTLALTGSRDRTARLWRTDTGAPVGEPLRHKDEVTAIAFSPDGRLVLTGSWDRTARLWRTDTGAPVGEPLRHKGVVNAVAFSPDGTLVLTGSPDRTARLWRTDTKTPVGEPMYHEDYVTAVAFSPDGTLVLTGSWDYTARLWRTDTGAPVGEPFRHERVVSPVAFSPDGKLALTGSGDGTARLWRIDTGAPTRPSLRHEDEVTAIAFSPDGRLVLTGSWDRTARLWRTDTGAPMGEPLRHDDHVWAVAFSPDGTLALTGSRDRTARLWGTDTGASIGSPLRHEDGVLAVALSPHGSLALTGSLDHTARLWRTDTGAPVGEPLRHERVVTAVAFSPDGKLALTVSREGSAHLWRTDTGAPLGEPLGHDDPVWAVAFSPDGTLALTGSRDRTARLWRTDTGAPVGEPLRHESYVNAVAFSPDGKLTLTGDWKRTVRLWRTDTKAPVGEPMHHEDDVTAVAFSPDGRLALTFTRRWVHVSRLERDGLVPVSNYLLSVPSPRKDLWPAEGAYRFFNDSERHLEVAVKPTGNSVRIDTLNLNTPQVLPLAGEPQRLVDEGHRRLALKFEAGKVVPLYDVPIATRDNETSESALRNQ